MPVQVCVNLPARDLHSIHLAEMVGQALQRHGLPPDALRLDINEQVLAGKPAQAATTLAELAALGVGISLDDFGTGYSSLAQLTRLGISEVKLDPALVSGLPNCTEKTMTVKSLVRLAQSLGIRSIGEGVETMGTAAALRMIGCDGAQGWHFAKPMEASLATAWLFEQTADSSPASDAGPPPDAAAEPGDQVGAGKHARQASRKKGQVADPPGQVAAEAYRGSRQARPDQVGPVQVGPVQVGADQVGAEQVGARSRSGQSRPLRAGRRRASRLGAGRCGRRAPARARPARRVTRPPTASTASCDGVRGARLAVSAGSRPDSYCVRQGCQRALGCRGVHNPR